MTKKSKGSWIVCKFGGFSVATPGNWRNICDIVAKHLAEGKMVLLVCSAIQGVTNQLEAAIDAAVHDLDFQDRLLKITETHQKLAASLGLDCSDLIGVHLERLESILKACSLCGDRPELRAQALAHGELMSTSLGAAFLVKSGLPAHWFDARKMLIARERSVVNGPRYYFGAQCHDDPDDALEQRLEQMGSLLVTQGFIASTPSGETALLGRGGSDTSAAYFAAKLSAERLEIWTDVPGMFTANPHHVANARIIKQISYAEAEVLAATGAKVLHPRCVAPVRKNGIPIYIKCTELPEVPGTVITETTIGGEAQGICALTARKNLFLVSARTGQQDHLEVLVKIMSYIRDHDIHVDSFSSGNGRVLIVVDPLISHVDISELEAMFKDDRWLKLHIQQGISSISLVGHMTSKLYGALGRIFSIMDPTRLLSLGNITGMDVTILLDYSDIEELVLQIHNKLLEKNQECEIFGSTWTEIQTLSKR